MTYISKLILGNWRNFRTADIPLRTRMFFVGPNASGKSNILDAVRFLRDLCKNGGGLQYAVYTVRGGLSKIRSLHARDPSDVTVGCEISDDARDTESWRYELTINQRGGGVQPLSTWVRTEKVWHGDRLVESRTPDSDDRKPDPRLEEYTYIEQPMANSAFREVADLLSSVQYLHIVPQLVKSRGAISGPYVDSFGVRLIERVAELNKKTRDSYFRRIEKALQIAVPQFEGLEFMTDDYGLPHLQTKFKHWRPKGARQWEDQFSDGTLRLIGFLWALLDGKGPLLLEEPELSLHPAIVQNLAEVIFKLQKRDGGRRQVLATTHSAELLANTGISGEEIAALYPGSEGTTVRIAADIEEVRALLEAGLSAADAVIPSTGPQDPHQLTLEL